jgi:DTW domain-containing protein YfiP
MCIHKKQSYLVCQKCGAWENRCLVCGMVLQGCLCQGGMSLRQMLKMLLPMLLITLMADVWDGVPEQTIFLIMWLVSWK